MAYVNPKQNQGFVLVTALLMLLAVTGIAVSLMGSSSIDLKITQTAQEREQSETLVKGDADKALISEMNKTADLNRFLFLSGQFDTAGGKEQSIDITPANVNSTVTLFNMNKGPVIIDCPPKFAATSGIKCNMLRVNTELNYGKNDKHLVAVRNGIVQELAVIGQSQ
jgi:type IV pilus assembly protein PilX